MQVSNREDLAAEVRKAIGRCSVPTLRGWLSRGCPGKDPGTGLYDVDAVVAWAKENIVYHEPAPVEPDTSDSKGPPKPKNWHDARAKEQTLTIRLERKEKQRELIPTDLVVEEFGHFIVEIYAQLEQLEVELPNLLPPKSCKRSTVKNTVRARIDDARNSAADFLESLRDTLTGSTTPTDAAPQPSDPPPATGTKRGSKKTGTSRKNSARTPATTGSAAGSNTGKARSKRSKRKKPKKSS